MSSAGIYLNLNDKKIGIDITPDQASHAKHILLEMMSTVLKRITAAGLQISTDHLKIFNHTQCHPLLKDLLYRYGFAWTHSACASFPEALEAITAQTDPDTLPDTLVVIYPTSTCVDTIIAIKQKYPEKKVWVAHSNGLLQTVAHQHMLVPSWERPSKKKEKKKKIIVLCDVENLIEAHAALEPKHLRSFLAILQATSNFLAKRGFEIDTTYSMACIRARHPAFQRIRALLAPYGIKLKSPPLGEPAENQLDYRAITLMRGNLGGKNFLVMSGDSDLAQTVQRIQEKDRQVWVMSWLNQSSQWIRDRADYFISIEEVMVATGYKCERPANKTDTLPFRKIV